MPPAEPDAEHETKREHERIASITSRATKRFFSEKGEHTWGNSWLMRP